MMRRADCGSPWWSAAGQVNYLQRIVLNVDKDLFDDEIYFWKNAMNMRHGLQSSTVWLNVNRNRH